MVNKNNFFILKEITMRKIINKIILSGLSCLLLFHITLLNAQQPDLAQDTVVVSPTTTQNPTEVVDFGLGKIQKSLNVTSSVSTLNADEIEIYSNVFSKENALYGKLSGLAVLQNGGEPWNRNPDMHIRGLGTLGNRSMLTVVDGVIRDVDFVNINEIESISVLKDASALALYGQRGANGVLVVTTKQGDYNSFNVDVSYQNGLVQPVSLPGFVDAYNYALAVNQANRLDGRLTDIYSQNELDYFQSGSAPLLYPNVNWVDEIIKPSALASNLNAQFRGGGESVRYFVSLNYQTEEGLFNYGNYDARYNSQLGYDRFNVRSNLLIDMTETTKLNIGLSGLLADRNYPAAGISNIMTAIYRTPALAYPVKTLENNWGGTSLLTNNPAALIGATGYRQDFERGFVGNVGLTQDLGLIVKGLSFSANVAYDNTSVLREGETRTYSYQSTQPVLDDNGDILDVIMTSFGLEQDLVTYDPNFNQVDLYEYAAGRFNLDYNLSWGEQNTFSASAIYNMDHLSRNGQNNTFKHQDIVAYSSIGIGNKYFVDASFSASGNSRLQPGSQFAYYPAVSAAWILSNESFLEENSLLSMLKLRASWGLSGNGLIDLYLYDEQFVGGGGYWFNGQTSSSGLGSDRLPTENLKPETAAMTNIGADIGLFDKLALAVDVYKERRTNILVPDFANTAGVLGYENPALRNEGIVENSGINIDLSYQNSVGEFRYWIKGTFAYNRNEIVEQLEQFRPYDYMYRTGNSIGQYYGYESVGFFEDENDIANSPQQLFADVSPGDIKYQNQNEDNVIDENDLTAVGNSWFPEIYYGGTIGIAFKGFTISADFQGTGNHSMYLNTQHIYRGLYENRNLSEYVYNNSWTPETASSATFPRLSLNDNPNNNRVSGIWLRSADYFKLRMVNADYSFPESISSKIRLSELTVFARGFNLFSNDDFELMDPEEIRLNRYPTLRSFHFGVKIGF
jgi:TonB-linked SusC/RagA family outer membrane protein